MDADTISVQPTKQLLRIHAAKNAVSDHVIDLKIDGPLSIHRGAGAPIMVTGYKKTGNITIHSHGMLTCTGSRCIPSPSNEFIPSVATVKGIDAGGAVLSDLLSSMESYIDNKKDPATKKNNPLITGIPGSRSITVTTGKRSMVATIDGTPFNIDSLFVAPGVIERATVQPGWEIEIDLDGASCVVGRDNMQSPARTVAYCASSVKHDDVYKAKSYLPIYKEQINAARSSIFSDTIDRARAGLGKGTCHIDGKNVCCRDDEDDDEICY
jgi:hypothetical protein